MKNFNDLFMGIHENIIKMDIEFGRPCTGLVIGWELWEQMKEFNHRTYNMYACSAATNTLFGLPVTIDYSASMKLSFETKEVNPEDFRR